MGRRSVRRGAYFFLGWRFLNFSPDLFGFIRFDIREIRDEAYQICFSRWGESGKRPYPDLWSLQGNAKLRFLKKLKSKASATQGT